MIKVHDIELHLAYWRNAIDGTLRAGFEPISTVKESADEIKRLLRASSTEARTAIDTALDLSLAFLDSASEDRTEQERVLAAVQSLHRTIGAHDIDPIVSALRPPLPTRPSGSSTP